jgi:uncharacterized protein (TIGR02118 family)
MIKVSVLYPNANGGRFDLDYYRNIHVPLVFERCGDAIKRGEMEQGIAGADASSPPPFRIAAHLVFDSAESMQASFGRHLPEFVADLPNFTDIQPMVQVSEVLLG